jgi:hypothetical protein
MELILKETIDRKKLEALISCPDLNPDEIHILKAMKKIQNKKDGSIIVSYNKRLDMGRRYPDKSISLGSISKRCRHTLVSSTHMDIDIANCHPVILSQYCEKNGIVCKVLNDYVKLSKVKMKVCTRKYVLQEIKNTTKIKSHQRCHLFYK